MNSSLPKVIYVRRDEETETDPGYLLADDAPDGLVGEGDSVLLGKYVLQETLQARQITRLSIKKAK